MLNEYFLLTIRGMAFMTEIVLDDQKVNRL